MDSLPSEEIIEIPVSELQAFFEDMIQVYNTLNEVLEETENSERPGAGRDKCQGKHGRKTRKIANRKACNS